MLLRRRLLIWTICLFALPSAASHAARPAKMSAAPSVASPTLRSRLIALKPWGKAKAPVKIVAHDTIGDRVMDAIARSTGSPRYIALLGGSMLAWMGWNAISGHPVDPLPFVGLNTFISLSTWTQQGFLQMTQNRQAALDRVREDKDHRVNLRAEREVRHLQTTTQQRFDDMQARLDAMQLQNEQLITLVESLAASKAK